jgi:hypothetical protein
MKCEQEETDLHETVKAAGPAPGVGAWRDSWRALEQLYTEGAVAAIGVSNFNVDEMRELFEVAKVPPMILQGNLWSLFFDPHLMDLLKEHEVHFQVFNALNGILQNAYTGPKAIAAQKDMTLIGEHVGGTFPQVVLRWLIEQGISVIPRSSSSAHVQENAAIAEIGALNPAQIDRSRKAIEVLLRPQWLGLSRSQREKAWSSIEATFFNHIAEDVKLYWVNGEEKEVEVGQISPQGEDKQNTHTGHRFVARTKSGIERRFTVGLDRHHLFHIHKHDEF